MLVSTEGMATLEVCPDVPDSFYMSTMGPKTYTDWVFVMELPK